MKSLQVLLILGCLILGGYSANLLRTDAGLKLRDSVSAISIDTFLNNSGLSDTLQAEGCFNSEFLRIGSKRLLAQCYENFYAPKADLLPGCIIYDTSNDTLAEVSRLNTADNRGRSNAFPSPNPALRYVASSLYRPLNLSLRGAQAAFSPNVFSIELHRYDASGHLEASPAIDLNMQTLNPLFYWYSISYNGLCGVSDDGKILLSTYLTVLQTQVYTLLKVNDNITSLTPLVTVEASPTEKAGYNSFCQTARLWRDKKDANIYHAIIPENSWNLLNPVGVTAQLSYWILDTASNTFVRQATDWLPRYIQGLHVDINKGRVYSISTKATPEGEPSSMQVPRAPYNNSAIDKAYNLRVWEVDTKKHTLNYKGGINTESDGYQVRASADGSLLAVTDSPLLVATIAYTVNNPLSDIAYNYAPNTVSVYSVSGNANLRLQLESAASASITSFCLSFDGNDRLAVGGTSTYQRLASALGGYDETGQKNVQLYSIDAN